MKWKEDLDAVIDRAILELNDEIDSDSVVHLKSGNCYLLSSTTYKRSTNSERLALNTVDLLLSRKR